MKPYNPLTKKEQQEKADKVAQNICIYCDGDYESKCKKCIWYLLMNSIIGENEW